MINFDTIFAGMQGVGTVLQIFVDIAIPCIGVWYARRIKHSEKLEETIIEHTDRLKYIGIQVDQISSQYKSLNDITDKLSIKIEPLKDKVLVMENQINNISYSIDERIKTIQDILSDIKSNVKEQYSSVDNKITEVLLLLSKNKE